LWASGVIIDQPYPSWTYTGLLGATAVNSACVGRRFSSNCCTFHPPATMSHAPGLIVRAAARIRPSASSREGAPIQLTSVLKLSAARMA
jgi:hypothetical protein